MNKKIDFSIEFRKQILDGKYKVETKCGLPARIICWEAKSDFPIVALVDYGVVAKSEDSDVGEIPYQYSSDGKLGLMKQDLDLVVVTDEPEFTRFEEKVKEIADVFSCGIEITSRGVLEYAEELRKAYDEDHKKTGLSFKSVLRIIDYAWVYISNGPEKNKEAFISYCEKLAEDLYKEGYTDDCNNVEIKIRYMRGYDVALAVQDEK